MGFLDRLTSLIGAGDGGPNLTGPLKLRPGDTVRYYQDAYVVTGVRALFLDRTRVFHYRLALESGGRAVLVAREDVEGLYSMQRAVEVATSWEAPEHRLPDGTVLTLSANGTARIRSVGDSGVGAAKAVAWREFADPESDVLLVLEDYGGVREARAGTPVHEGELAFTREEAVLEAAPWSDAESAEGIAEPEAVTRGRKGSPNAAARVLEGRAADDDDFAADGPYTIDRDPIKYEDAEWADAYEETAPVGRPLAGIVPRKLVPGWLKPTLWVKGSGYADLDEVEDDWLVAARPHRDAGS